MLDTHPCGYVFKLLECSALLQSMNMYKLHKSCQLFDTLKQQMMTKPLELLNFMVLLFGFIVDHEALKTVSEAARSS